MDVKCELIKKCGFYNNFLNEYKNIKEGWITLYCSSLEKSERCKRKKIRQETGTPPPDNMTPTGKLI